MKATIKKIVIFAVILATLSICLAVSAFAITNYANTTFTSNYFYGNTDKDPMTYEVGETMTFTVSFKSVSGDLVSVPYFSYSFKGDDGMTASGRVSGENGTFTVSHKILCPGFVRLTVKALDADGNEIDDSVRFNGGACAEWEKIETAMAEPDDFDEYWERTLRELDAVAPTIYDLKVDTVNSNNSYTVYDLYVNAPGSKNFLNTAGEGEEPNGATYMAGKLTVPTNLDLGTAKFYLSFQGAGVYTSPGISKKAGHVTLCVYAHSIELSRESEYYTDLNKGLLSNYMKRALYNDNAEESYTKYMILRDLQAVRFLKTFFGEEGGNVTEFNGIDISGWKGLWNGKDIDIYGQSQGGFQCIAVAALDHDITLCRPWVPCWCDMYATDYFPTRMTMGLVYKHYSQKYFDSVALGKRIVCRTEVNTGFGDDTCPTPGVIAAYNAMTCEKVLNIYQGMPHNCSTNYSSGVAKQKYTSGVENFKLPYNWEFTFDWDIASVSDTSVLQILADGKTVKALKKGTSTVEFSDPNRESILVEVETAAADLIITDGSLDPDTAAGMIKSLYTRTGNTAFVADSWNDVASDLSAGNITKGITYYVISDLGGELSYTAAEMYALYEASGADYLVLIPGSTLTPTTAAMYAMQVNNDKYPGAYVCDNGSASGAYEAGRNAGNNIVSIIEKNKPVLDAAYKVYDANTGNEINTLSVLEEGETYSIVVIYNQPYNIINGITVVADGLEFDSETLTVTSDSDGGTFVVNGKTYTVYADAVGYGVEDNYSWVLDSNGKLTVLSSGAVSDTEYPWAEYASIIKEIEVTTGVTSIASGAFAGVSNLTKLTLPYTLEEIASDAVNGATSYTVYGYESNKQTKAFADAVGMKFVSLGACGSAGDSLMWEYADGVLTISGNGTTAYSGCTGYDLEENSSWYDYYSDITKVVISEGVKIIDPYCFHKMPSLVTVELPKSLVTLNKGAFMACGNLKTVYIAGNTPVVGTIDLSNVTAINGGYQFDGGARSASTFILSDKLTGGLGDKFITLNSAMKALTIPAGVTSLASRSISGNSALKELTVLGKDTTISSGALDYSSTNSTVLTTVYGRVGTPAEAFAVSKGITFVDLTGDKYDGEIVLNGDCGTDVYFKIIENETEGTYTLYFYGSGAEIESGSNTLWSPYSDSITRVVFRGSIASIGADTLNGLTALEEIAFDNSAITSVCANAFTNTGISGTFHIPAEIEVIEANAFADTDITAVAIHNDEAVIDTNAFADSNVSTIYGYYKSTANTFATNNSITFVNINDILPVATGYLYGEYQGSVTVSTIWYYNKAEKTLTFVSDKSGWNETGRIALATDGIGWTDYINEVEKIVIGSGLSKVTQYAFQNHTALKTVELSTSVSQIDVSAFRNCKKLDTIYVAGNVPIEGVADLHRISTLHSQATTFANCAFDTLIPSAATTAIKDGSFSGTPVATVIGNSENTAAVAEVFSATVLTGYVDGNTVWTVDDGTLTIYANGTPAAVSAWSDYAETVTNIVFESGCDIKTLNTGVFDGFTNLAEVLFKCDAPESAAAACFGVNKITVFYAKGITTFSSPNWNGYVCLEEGSALGIVDTGLCKEGGYTWSFDELGTLTISGTGNGVLEFTQTPYYNSLSRIPWYAYFNQIKKVVIEEETKITKIVAYGLSNMKYCETIIIPTTLTNLGEYNVFCVLHRLNTIAVQGNEVVEGVIDLRNVTRINSQLFEQSFNYTTPEIYLPATPDSFSMIKWANSCADLTFITYPTSKTATYVRTIAEKQSGSSASSNLPDKVTLKYYTEEQDATLVRSGSQTVSGGHMDWVFDDATGTLTFTKGAGAGSWNEFLYNAGSNVLSAWLGIWKDAIVHINVASSFSKFQINNDRPSLFSNLVNLETVKFAQGSMEWQCSSSNGIFENCQKLTTLGFGSSYTEGVIDFSPIYKFASASHRSMLKGCASVTSVKLRSTAPTGASPYCTQITNNFFEGCTSLVSITIPAWVTDISANAFAGCTSLVSVTLEGDTNIASANAFPDNEGQELLIYCNNQSQADAIAGFGYTYTKHVYFGGLQTAVQMEGFAVRIEEYNGLRGLFNFDNTVKDANAENGFTIVEYGAIITTQDNYNTYGKELTLVDGNYVTANSRVVKKPVFKGEEQVGNILGSSTEDVVKFAASIVRYTGNYKTNVYVCAYEIWQSESGATAIYYTDCPNDEYDFTNLYEISLNMYKNGLVNSENDVEGIVWNVLAECGVVTLTAGKDYNYVDGQTDLAGNSLAESFRFADVPAVNQSVNSSAKTISFNNTNLTITLLEDGENYVAVYRGKGAMPKTNPWNDAGTTQLSEKFCADYSVSAVPNPKMLAATTAKIKTVVVDYGVTALSAAAFSKMFSLETVIYPTTVTSFGETLFVNCLRIKTVYCADVNDPNYTPKSNIVDLSDIPTGSARYMFVSAKAVEYIHLPANVGTGASGIINSCNNLKAIWCGDVEMVEGTADFSQTALKTFADYAFSAVTKLDKVVLPTTAATFYDVNNNVERHAFKNSGITTIVTESEVAKITEYMATYGETYGLTYVYGTASAE